ncbi:MAG: threonylcarbamoyl-AMP synthase [Bacteroidales bacterium]|nr:threonylcarbamoyl-AMP synthase [Bacteroidales bacterium]
MKLLRIYPTNINERFIDEAVDALRDGHLIIYPTDTLYAIGCDALNNRAIEQLCRLKDLNPQKQTLSIACADISQASEYARIDNRAFQLMRQYLPGPFTFLLPSATTLPKVFKGRKVVGVRIPDNPITNALANALGHPLLTTSITYDPDEPLSGMEPEEIGLRYDGLVSLMIDGGSGQLEPSTVVDITDSSSPEILRQGAGTL